jgi:hypothetical protein
LLVVAHLVHQPLLNILLSLVAQVAVRILVVAVVRVDIEHQHHLQFLGHLLSQLVAVAVALPLHQIVGATAVTAF